MAFTMWLTPRETDRTGRVSDSYIASYGSDAVLLLQITSHLHWGINTPNYTPLVYIQHQNQSEI